MSETGKRRIAILGSTGSIGTQAIDVIGARPDLFEAVLLTANNNWELLVEQAIRLQPSTVVICNEAHYDAVSQALQPHDIKVFAGMDSVCDLMSSSEIDMVLAAMVGFSGLRPTLAALEAGKAVALANKETLVAAGSVVMPLAAERGAPILPVDSEHSAIFQCLQGERVRPEKLILTGSGGPFRTLGAEELSHVTVADALNHPRWKMGAKVTIDSATLMNKGLELIEARWLFDIPAESIEVLIHPESVIHSMVRFGDGSVMAQMATPDMRLPIQYALSYPYRLQTEIPKVDFAALGTLTFEEPDTLRFPALSIAREALTMGGNACCAMNGANEVAVEAFLKGVIPFTAIPRLVALTLEKFPLVRECGIETIYSTDFEAKRLARELLKQI